jgi:hypothetical protein
MERRRRTTPYDMLLRQPLPHAAQLGEDYVARDPETGELDGDRVVLYTHHDALDQYLVPWGKSDAALQIDARLEKRRACAGDAKASLGTVEHLKDSAADRERRPLPLRIDDALVRTAVDEAHRA